MRVRLLDLAEVIRSKNAGPFELTIDIIFRNLEDFKEVCSKKIIRRELIAEIYGIELSDVLDIVEFPPAKAIKINLRRPVTSGAVGETDVYGAQQHAPLLALEFEL